MKNEFLKLNYTKRADANAFMSGFYYSYFLNKYYLNHKLNILFNKFSYTDLIMIYHSLSEIVYQMQKYFDKKLFTKGKIMKLVL
jgi:hypothetical protein